MMIFLTPGLPIGITVGWYQQRAGVGPWWPPAKSGTLRHRCLLARTSRPPPPHPNRRYPSAASLIGARRPAPRMSAQQLNAAHLESTVATGGRRDPAASTRPPLVACLSAGQPP